MKSALITGITGQDGSYLAELLLEKGYLVHGIVRRTSTIKFGQIDDVYTNPQYRDKSLFLHYGDLEDSSSINRILEKTQPDEIYNLGAQSHVKISFEIPEYTANVDAIGSLRILDAIKDKKPNAKFYQASSSEMFGKVSSSPQNENTPFYPRSPYGCSKVFSYWITKNYRESYNLFTCNGILFNHESPRRGENFVTRKITSGLSKIKLGLQDCLYLGNLDAKRDWGYAKDYVEAMWLMLQQPTPDDYVIATNESHTVREFVEETCKCLNIKIQWKNQGINEVAINLKNNQPIIKIDPMYFRPSEVDILQGDYSKAKQKLNWQPKVKFKELVKIMVKKDYDSISKDNR